MTVAANDRVVRYSGNGSTTVFAYDFKIVSGSDLRVTLVTSAGVETVQTITTHYSVSGVGDAGGGNVTFVTAPATGSTVVIEGRLAPAQTSSIPTSGAFPATTVEAALDKLTRTVQEHETRLARGFRTNLKDTASEIVLPPAADLVNKVFHMGADGKTPTAIDTDISTLDDIVDELSADADRAELAADRAEVAAALAGVAGNGRMPIYYFPILGQSNGEGRGDKADASYPSPVTTGYYITGGVISSPLADSVGGASTGSAWPAFSNQWELSKTGTKAIFTDLATGGSALIAAANPANNWSATGSLRAAAVSAINTNIAAIQADTRFQLIGVMPIWVQGEQDATELFAGTAGVSKANYKTEFATLVDYLKANITIVPFRFGIIRIGSKNDRSQNSTSTPAWSDIRAAQDELCASRADCRMLYRGTSSFAKDALNYMDSATTGTDVHWGQQGLNLAGKCAAIESAATVASSVPTAPALLGSASITTDTDITTTLASPRTISYTTHASAQGLIVVVVNNRNGSTSGSVLSGCTFNGVTMKLATKNTASNLLANAAGSTGSAAGRVDVMVYHIGNAAYLAATGSNIAGVTANVVISWNANVAHLNQVWIQSVDSDIIEETTPCTNASTATAALTVNPGPGNAALCVAVAGSNGDAAAALTCTWTGLTEIMDSGGSNGTRACQMSVATGTLTANVVATVTATLSGNATEFGLMAACFRKRVSGEEAA